MGSPIDITNAGTFETQDGTGWIGDRAKRLLRYILEHCDSTVACSFIVSDDQAMLLEMIPEFKSNRKCLGRINQDGLLKFGKVNDIITIYRLG